MLELASFDALLPDEPYCSLGKGREAVIRDKVAAKSYPLIEPNHPHLQCWIALDIDREDSVNRWERIGLPPNLVMENDLNGHAHYLYRLDKPVYRKKGEKSSKPDRFLKAVKRGLTFGLGGDMGYSGFLVKNPFHPDWRTYSFRDDPYTLGEIAKKIPSWVPPSIQEGDGRNNTVFHALRKWAYRNLHRYEEKSAWNEIVLNIASDINEFPEPLLESEIRAIAKSVANWVWNNYTGSGWVPRERVMKLNQEIPLADRQRLGQNYAAGVKVQNTKSMLRMAIEDLISEDLPVTQLGVSERSGKSLRTVKTYWKEIRNG